MKKLTLSFAGLALLLTSLAPATQAQNVGSPDVVGTWYFFLTLDGQPVCQVHQDH